jgi:primosomal protein N' (replication factor Y)
VATEKPLSLRRQKGAYQSKRSSSSNKPAKQAEIFVDSGVFHLDETYSYCISEELENEVRSGSVVWVPFNNKKVMGIVKEIGNSTVTGLKYIDSIALSSGLTPPLMELADRLTQRYATSRFDLFRFMLPPLLKRSTESPVHVPEIPALAKTSSPHRIYVQCEIGESSLETVAHSLIRDPSKRRLVVMPTLRDVITLRDILEKSGISGVMEFGSHLTPRDRREAFHLASQGDASVVVGTRSAIFAPMLGLQEIVVLDEYSPHHHENKSPFWNTRDVAVSRSEIEGVSLVFVGNSASLELHRLVESGWIKTKNRASLLSRPTRRLIVTSPDSYHSVMKDGLARGPVLLSVVEKHYSNVFNCERCRTVARCDCGGRVIIESKNVFACSLCDKKERAWRCRECGESKIRTFRFGAERITEDIGKSFPGTPIFLNTAEKLIEGDLPGRSIVVSTFGVEPLHPYGYGAIVLLGGEDLVNRPFIRSEEETLHRWFKVLSYLHKEGSIFISLPSQHGIAQAIIQQKPTKFLNSELIERSKALLPPHSRLITISSDSLTIVSLRQKLESEFSGKLTSHTSTNGGTVTLKVDHKSSIEILVALRALQKLRSIRNKKLLSIQVDPYEV